MMDLHLRCLSVTAARLLRAATFVAPMSAHLAAVGATAKAESILPSE